MHSLVMRFTTATEGKLFVLTVDGIRTEYKNGAQQPIITEEEVIVLMDLILAKNIFATSSGSLTGKKDAKVVSVTTSSFEVE